MERESEFAGLASPSVEFLFPSILLPKQTGSALTMILLNKLILDVTDLFSEQRENSDLAQALPVSWGNCKSCGAPSLWGILEICTFVMLQGSRDLLLREKGNGPRVRATVDWWPMGVEYCSFRQSCLSHHPASSCAFISNRVRLTRLWLIGAKRVVCSGHAYLLRGRKVCVCVCWGGESIQNDRNVI